MNREDIIKMAREADPQANTTEPYIVTNDWVFRFAALVAAAEREACAKVCGDLHIEGEDDTGLAADLIRARKEAT